MPHEKTWPTVEKFDFILLTGASGFIGSHLLQKLTINGKSPHIYSTSGNQMCEPLESKIVETIRVLLLCGGYVQHSPLDGNSLSESEKSWAALTNLLKNDFKKLEKIIYLSTTDVYEDAVDISEKSQTRISNLYVKTKIEQEDYLRTYAYSHGVKFLVLRLGNIYGPRAGKFSKFLPQLIDCSVRNLVFEQRISGNRTMQHLYINDVIEFIIHAIDADVPSEVVNLTGFEETTVDQIIEIVAFKKPIRILRHYSGRDFVQRTFRLNSYFAQNTRNRIEIEFGIKETWEYEFKKHSNS